MLCSLAAARIAELQDQGNSGGLARQCCEQLTIMALETKIRIDLIWDGSTILGVRLAPRRLLDIGRLVRGKSVAEAARAIPLLFSLCGKAQGVAAALALAAAHGDTDISPDRERQVVGEAVQEMAWRFLIDLPPLFGMTPAPQALAALRKQFAGQTPAADLEAFIATHFLAMPCKAWREFTAVDQLENWLNRADTPAAQIIKALWHAAGDGNAVALLPDFNEQQITGELLPALLAAPTFAARPNWRGQPAETGALARLAGHPLMREILHRQGAGIAARLLARLLELARLADALRGDTLSRLGWIRCAQVRENAGLAWLQTSRGLLVHYAEVEDGAVADYRIVAPTEWNFHPDGALAHGLTGKAAASENEVRRHAELLLLALDPCVGYEIRIIHA